MRRWRAPLKRLSRLPWARRTLALTWPWIATLAPLGVLTVAAGADLTTVSPYSFALNGALLMVAAVVAPTGITGVIRSGLRRARPIE